MAQWLPSMWLKPRADRYSFWIESSHPRSPLSVTAKRFSSWLVISRSREPVPECVSLLDPILNTIHSPYGYYLCHTMGLFHLRSPSSVRNQFLSYYEADLILYSSTLTFSFHICDLASIAKPYHSHHLQPDSLSQATKRVDSSAYSNPPKPFFACHTSSCLAFHSHRLLRMMIPALSAEVFQRRFRT